MRREFDFSWNSTLHREVNWGRELARCGVRSMTKVELLSGNRNARDILVFFLVESNFHHFIDATVLSAGTLFPEPHIAGFLSFLAPR